MFYRRACPFTKRVAGYISDTNYTLDSACSLSSVKDLCTAVCVCVCNGRTERHERAVPEPCASRCSEPSLAFVNFRKLAITAHRRVILVDDNSTDE